ncbi:uncharacterized protein LOC141627699 [Silene latifolia]|uniref:uncharacterized protein LOC141627699 n=1 Tax=Silene latifolia TaxID=37657 RepID=UPI003D788A47
MKQLCSVYSPLYMIGDFNQIEQYSDKIGGLSTITGWNAFVDWRINTHLCELPFSGPKYTWANKIESSNLILERLDRGYASQDWLLTYPEAHIQNLFIFLSDHAPIVLDLSARFKKPKKRLNHADIQRLVSSIWHSFSYAPVASSVTKKLGQIRIASQIHDSISGSQYLRHLKVAEHDVQLQHSFWQQSAKSDFQFTDGLPTAFFFSRAKARQKKLRIISLKDNTESWTSSESDLYALIMNHFQKLFASSQPTNSFSELEALSFHQLDDLQQSYLSQPFTAADVKKAFFDMKPNKSPGPDGFPPAFYHLFWHTINVDITSSILGFLNNGHLPPAWNNTHIVLIPKVPNPECISQFRPISLCNVIYRAASKCISLRLRKVLINGTPSVRFFPQCGLRQGDPISPYLFILCMEILSLMIIKAESEGTIEDGNAFLLLQFPLTLFAIWKLWNNVIFRENSVCPAEIFFESALLSQQQRHFASRSKAYDHSACLSEVVSPVFSIPQHFAYYFRMEVVFHKKTLIGSFKVY